MVQRRTSSAYWRDQASTYRQLAVDLPAGKLRDALERIAGRYEQIADSAEWARLHGAKKRQRSLVKDPT
jgi:hypothetical protein